MFWNISGISASSPVETVLDKENFTLEELLDEEEIIQECKVLNSRLITFLRDRAQIEQLLHYVIDEPPEDAESKRAFKYVLLTQEEENFENKREKKKEKRKKLLLCSLVACCVLGPNYYSGSEGLLSSFRFPFIACEIFTCEIDVILRTLVEEEELMDLLFSFLKPNRPHGTLLAGYFSKVVICLMLRKTVPLLKYVQAHQDVLCQLVDLIGITSIMEVLVRLVGADDHVYPNFIDVMQWLADSNLLEMIVDKLSPSSPSEVHANAAETLCAITRNAPSALATKLSSPSFVARIFGHALEDSESKSGLVHSLSVCISLLDPKRSAIVSPLMQSFRSQHIYEPPIPVNPETIDAMLPRLGNLLVLLNLLYDENILPTTYGELKPPLGKHRLKIVEFIAVLLRTGNEATEKELVSSGTIKRVLDLFFEYPYNNALHHHVESIILSCLEAKSSAMIDHLIQDCDLMGKFLQTDKHPVISGDANQPTLPATGKQAPRVGNIGHITRISNKLVQLANSNSHIQKYLLENVEWNQWQSSVLQERNVVENVYRWGCGRPAALQDRTRDSDEDETHDRDYDVAALANNISQAFRYKMYGNEDAEDDNGGLDRDEEDVYFDDESAEVVISSLRLGDEQVSSLFTNSNWFAFQDDRIDNAPTSTSPTDVMNEINLDGTANGGSSSSDDEVVVGEDDELTESKVSANDTSTSNAAVLNGFPEGGPLPENDKGHASQDANFFRFETPDSEDLFGDRPIPEWVGWGEPSDMQVGGLSLNPFENHDDTDVNVSSQPEVMRPEASSTSSGESVLPNGSLCSNDSSDPSASTDNGKKSTTVPSLFEEDVEFVGVELEATEKAMEQAPKEGIVGEAEILKRSIVPNLPEMNSEDSGPGMK